MLKPRLLLFALVIACAAPAPADAQSARLPGTAQFLVSAAATPAPSPCDDSLFVSLQGRALDSLSAREYEYFMLKTKECGEYRKAALAGGKSATASRKHQVGISTFNDSAPEPDGNTAALLLVTVGILAIVATLSLGIAMHNMVIF